MDTSIREGNILEFKALTMSKAMFIQVPTYQPKDCMPEMVGWVNYEGEWYLATTGGRLVRIRRTDIWDTFAARYKAETMNYQVINEKLDAWRDNLRQVFLK